MAVLAATQAVDIPFPPLAPVILDPAGNAAPSSSAAAGYGNPAFVQQLSSMVSILEQNLVAVQGIKQAAAKEAEAQRLVRPQLACGHTPSPPPIVYAAHSQPSTKRRSWPRSSLARGRPRGVYR
jgi:hypothetical protein